MMGGLFNVKYSDEDSKWSGKGFRHVLGQVSKKAE